MNIMAEVQLLNHFNNGVSAQPLESTNSGTGKQISNWLGWDDAEAEADEHNSTHRVLRQELNKGSCQLCSSALHNCDWVKTSLPFVCKVIHHIQELEAKTELWFRQFTASVQKETQERSQSSEKLNENAQSDMTSTNLCVEGVGLDATENDQTTALHEEARAVLSEIIGLMEQLEAERQKTEEALKVESERVTTLGNKIDQLSLWWLKELPEAVQKEHDICSLDVCELQWHVEDKAFHLQNLQNQVTDAGVLNQRLREEINLMKKLEYHLKEKLDLEQNTINDILPNLREVTEIFNKVDRDLNKVQQDFKSTSTKAQLEEKVMHAELASIASKTKQLRMDTINAEALFNIYTTQERKTQDQLAEAERSYNQLINERVDLDQQKTIRADNVKQLKINYAEKQAAISVLTEACIELKKTIEDRTRIGNFELSKQEIELDRKQRELMRLENKSKEFELEIESFNRNIKESRQERNKMKKEIRQIQEALKINKGKLANLKKQLTLVVSAQNSAREKLVMITKTMTDQEEQLKDQIEKLKKKIKEEMVLRTKLQAKIKSEAEDLANIKDNANKKKESILKKITQAEKIVADIEAKFKEFEAIYQNYYETFLMLSEKVNELKENQQSITENLEKEKKGLQNQLIDDQKEYLDSINQLNYTLRQIETLQENSRQKQALRTVLLKEIEKYKNSIKDLKPIRDVVEFKHNNAAIITNGFKTELEIVKKRRAFTEKDDQKLIRERKNKRQEVRVKLALTLMENANQTEEYQRLQRSYLGTKNKLADIYDDRLKTEVSIKDYLQLSALQTRMHQALVEYFKQQGLYSQAVLATSQAVSHENAQKIIAVQGKMSKSIQRISAFLQSLADACETKEDTANKQCNQDGVIKDKKSHAVQITV
ncbi:coiled-coil domain-containing protein 178 isoform X2 [Heptranchias perlo]|uniref:coiled-coil domain-containing protein 178 isoform X2 n=1 Tax=Heptranchias perlo TaxID=212740 RepID=UPI003559CB3F